MPKISLEKLAALNYAMPVLTPNQLNIMAALARKGNVLEQVLIAFAQHGLLNKLTNIVLINNKKGGHT